MVALNNLNLYHMDVLVILFVKSIILYIIYSRDIFQSFALNEMADHEELNGPHLLVRFESNFDVLEYIRPRYFSHTISSCWLY